MTAHDLIARSLAMGLPALAPYRSELAGELERLCDELTDDGATWRGYIGPNWIVHLFHCPDRRIVDHGA